MRVPHQILAFPYKKDENNQYLYGILKRNSNKEIWQGIAGGVEDNESYLEACKREANEEACISYDAPVIELKSISTMPVPNVTKDFIWGEDVYLITEHCFGIDASNEKIILSHEHTEIKWLTFEDAKKLLTWDSNKNALWELNYLLNNTEFYYKAYEDRYQKVHEANMIWSSRDITLELKKFIGLNKEQTVLDLGCGEGRDTIFLLNKGYDVVGIDYSKSAINKCNEISNYEYENKFKQFDIFKDKINKKFDKIYSISVLHMFVLQKHRNDFYKFIYDHLDKDGSALVTVLGDGNKEFVTDINNAFNIATKKVLNANENIDVVNTSCKIVDWNNLTKEISENNLIIEKKWISYDIPEFNESMCIILKRSK